jgi:hypothetical protein
VFCARRARLDLCSAHAIVSVNAERRIRHDRPRRGSGGLAIRAGESRLVSWSAWICARRDGPPSSTCAYLTRKTIVDSVLNRLS